MFYTLSSKSSWLSGLFRYSISLLIKKIFLFAASISLRSLFKSPIVIVGLYISPGSSRNICFIYFEGILLDIYKFGTIIHNIIKYHYSCFIHSVLVDTYILIFISSASLTFHLKSLSSFLENTLSIIFITVGLLSNKLSLFLID